MFHASFHRSHEPLGTPCALCRSLSHLAAAKLRATAVSACPSGTFYAKIRSGNMRLGLGTFNTADEAARAYHAALWRLSRSHTDMNFPEVITREWAQRLAPPPWVVTEEDRHQNQRRERCLGIAEMDEHAMVEWRQQFPHDILDERAFFAQRRVERRAERAAYRQYRRTRKQGTLFNMELKEATTWSSDDERLAHVFITTTESDTSASEEDDEE
ncbi:hypothetical protein ZWY2020_043226 [Hordeum vulgare]|nr:hypothetical protein ZWY2020_043226 [Hordeum vulgare]